ncbi:protein of unknown function [Methylorubrum extorquens]|uniref:Uncharacterized protein n=1 Tax=Methylorubrum extorquens TaxID=408 RepID=A0A2N9AJD7_METEX|nr:protein of unknown function [Methylorubrum extorquens]
MHRSRSSPIQEVQEGSYAGSQFAIAGSHFAIGSQSLHRRALLESLAPASHPLNKKPVRQAQPNTSVD